VFRTSKADATPADIERWAAQRGCIVANIRHIPPGTLVQYEDRMVQTGPGCHIWTADIILSEEIE
jgi:hypothetical protein